MRVLQVPSGFVYATIMTYRMAQDDTASPKLRRPATPRVRGVTGVKGVTRTGVTRITQQRLGKSIARVGER